VKKLRRVSWARHIPLMEYMRNAYNILVGKPEGRSPFGRPRHK
jgi:hypothetical protein